MPCRCDYYEVTAADVRAELGKKLEHSEGQLCNARSLIHKLMKWIGDDSELSPDLAARAKEHIALLLAHKREEHNEDKATAAQRLANAQATVASHKRQLQAESASRLEVLKKAEAEESRLRAVVAKLTEPTDEELLG